MQLNSPDVVQDTHGDNVDVRFLVDLIRMNGSAETVLRDTSLHIIAMIPVEHRVPDPVPGGLYQSIATGRMELTDAVRQMDQRCVVHSLYAERWLAHCWYDENDFSRRLVSYAEAHGLVNGRVYNTKGRGR